MPDTVALGVDRAHVAAAGASVPIGSNGVRVAYHGCSSGRGGLWNQQEKNSHNASRGRSTTKRRIGPVRHNATDEFPLTDFANKIRVRLFGIDVKPNVDQLDDVKTLLWRYKRDCVKTSLLRKLDYRVRSCPLPSVNEPRDDCIAPFATRYGLGYFDGMSVLRWRRGEFT